MKKIPLGIDDYEAVCRDCYYVDKTSIISNLIDTPIGTSLLFSRPRRFGKSLMISMLQSFFENTNIDKSELFIDKAIYQNKEAMEGYFQKFPVVHLDLKNAIAGTYADLIVKLRELISNEYERHSSLLGSECLTDNEKSYFKSILEGKASDIEYTSSLLRLTAYLEKATKQKVIVLIDEYDTPAHCGFINGYYDSAILFLKQLFSSLLKSNPSLRLAVITGVLQIAKESLFSGLNNLIVNSVMSTNFDEGFGFTERETDDLLNYYGYQEKTDDVRKWYGGYRFGDTTVYNPLSVLNYLQSGGQFLTYWNNTADNIVLGSIIEKMNDADCLLPLLSGESIPSPIDIALSYKDLNGGPQNVLSFLYASGYLTIDKQISDLFYSLTIPNKEIETVFRREIASRYIKQTDFTYIFELKSAFEKGDNIAIQKSLEKYLLSSFSYYEFGKEKNYQTKLASALSLIFENYVVKNEMNAGNGRADIIVFSKEGNLPAFIIEVKALKSNAGKSRLQKYAQKAISQIKEQDYISELKPFSPSYIQIYGMAFYKKRAQIESEQIVLL